MLSTSSRIRFSWTKNLLDISKFPPSEDGAIMQDSRECRIINVRPFHGGCSSSSTSSVDTQTVEVVSSPNKSSNSKNKWQRIKCIFNIKKQKRPNKSYENETPASDNKEENKTSALRSLFQKRDKKNVVDKSEEVVQFSTTKWTENIPKHDPDAVEPFDIQDWYSVEKDLSLENIQDETNDGALVMLPPPLMSQNKITTKKPVMVKRMSKKEARQFKNSLSSLSSESRKANPANPNFRLFQVNHSTCEMSNQDD